MKNTGLLVTIYSLLVMLIVPYANALEISDGFYKLADTIAAWDGTDAKRTKARSNSYYYTYGDEKSIIYTLPWSFNFYGQSYNQINVDTNGNIWFGVTGFAHSFTLASNGRGPAISAWNSDLSSNYYGGAFVQRKTDAPLGDRVVIEWKTETYTDEGYNRPNNFEVVLFPDGNIRIDYNYFNAANRKDIKGSGISNNDGTHFLNITANFDAVYNLAGKSFSVTGMPKSVNVHFTGTGSGIVTSSPAGISCNTDCSSGFYAGSQVTLHPEPHQYSTFSGWSNGTCTGLGDCLIAMSADASATAGFARDTAHQVKIGGTNYTTIQAAYNAAATGNIIKTWATDYTETVNCNRGMDVTLQGGYDSSYVNQVGTTVIHGRLNISQGKVVVKGIAIR